MSIELEEKPKVICPEPGIYRSIGRDYYHWNAISKSTLWKMSQTPAHFALAISEGMEATDEMEFGTAFHTLLESEKKFQAEYLISDGPINDKTGKPYGSDTLKHQAWRAEQTKKIISTQDASNLASMKRSVMAHPDCALALSGEMDTELSIVWDDEKTGLRLKGRVDYLRREYQCAIDIKTAKDASWRGFSSAIASFGYHVQASMYTDGLMANGIEASDFVFVAIEKTAPFAVGTYRLSTASLEEGRKVYRRLLSDYIDCAKRGHWPSWYYPAFTEISLPAWARDKHQPYDIPY